MLVSYASDDDSEKEIPVKQNLRAAPDVETAAAVSILFSFVISDYL